MNANDCFRTEAVAGAARRIRRERHLVGRCGCSIGVDPAWYRGGHRLTRAVDEAVPADLAFDGVELPLPDRS